MAPLRRCLCCGIHQGSIFATNYAIIAYGGALGLTLWWIIDLEGNVPLPSFVLIALYFITFFASVVCVLSLSVQRKATVVAAWLVMMAMFLLPECGLNVWISLFILGSNTAIGLGFLIFYVVRAILNIICMVCMHSLYSQWKTEKRSIKRRVDEELWKPMYEGPKPPLMIGPPPSPFMRQNIPMLTYPEPMDCHEPKMVSAGETINYTVEEPSNKNESCGQIMRMPGYMPPPQYIYDTTMMMPPPYFSQREMGTMPLYGTMHYPPMPLALPWYPTPPLTAPPRTKKKKNRSAIDKAQHFVPPPPLHPSMPHPPMMIPYPPNFGPRGGFQSMPARMGRRMTMTKVTTTQIHQQGIPRLSTMHPKSVMQNRPAIPMSVYDIDRDTEPSFDNFIIKKTPGPVQMESSQLIKSWPNARPMMATDSSTTDETGYHSRRSNDPERRRKKVESTRPRDNVPRTSFKHPVHDKKMTGQPKQNKQQNSLTFKRAEFYGRENVLPPSN